MSSTVSGMFTDATGAVGAVTGTFVPSSFTASNHQVLATGTLTATLTDAAGSVVGTATKAVTLPVQVGGVQPQVACPILNLVLGPLDLNLLGLQVHLDRVVLVITAQPGPGNLLGKLLGNLLCAIAGLLNGTGLLNGSGPLNQLAALLDQPLVCSTCDPCA